MGGFSGIKVRLVSAPPGGNLPSSGLLSMVSAPRSSPSESTWSSKSTIQGELRIIVDRKACQKGIRTLGKHAHLLTSLTASVYLSTKMGLCDRVRQFLRLSALDLNMNALLASLCAITNSPTPSCPQSTSLGPCHAHPGSRNPLSVPAQACPSCFRSSYLRCFR